MYHFILLETNFHFQHSSFRRDLGFTQCSPGITLTDLSLTTVLNQISHTALLQRLIFVSVLAVSSCQKLGRACRWEEGDCWV